ncbi:hypothetical protein ACWEKT_32300 [Nocardia takedensis]
MSPVPMPTRVHQIRPPDAAGLRQVHRLASESAAARRALTDTGLSQPQRTVLNEQIAGIDRGRALAEITVRGQGVPAVWVDVARRLGSAGVPWTGEQILPPIPRDRTRRSPRRVAEDTHLLADMAALSAVRDHFAAREGLPGDRDSPEAVQVRRNMGAIRHRSAQTAHEIGLTDTDQRRITRQAGADLDKRIRGYLDLEPADVEVLWHAYTGGDIADAYRRSITAHPGAHQRPNGTVAELPQAQYWLDRAHTAVLDTLTEDHSAHSPSTDIDRAAAAALSTPTATPAPTEEDLPVSQARPLSIEAGPDP